jgi:hypothetical protein
MCRMALALSSLVWGAAQDMPTSSANMRTLAIPQWLFAVHLAVQALTRVSYGLKRYNLRPYLLKGRRESASIF